MNSILLFKVKRIKCDIFDEKSVCIRSTEIYSWIFFLVVSMWLTPYFFIFRSVFIRIRFSWHFFSRVSHAFNASKCNQYLCWMLSHCVANIKRCVHRDMRACKRMDSRFFLPFCFIHSQAIKYQIIYRKYFNKIIILSLVLLKLQFHHSKFMRKWYKIEKWNNKTGKKSKEKKIEMHSWLKMTIHWMYSVECVWLLLTVYYAT